MKDSFNHTDFEKEFFKKTNIQYSKSKEDVWLELDAKLDETKKAKVLKVNFRKVIYYAAAAVLVLGLSVLTFLKYYSISIYCPKGQHSLITLPDGSRVTLNASSELSYHPYWWKYNREIDFDGEAFFKVTKGDKFSVVSENGTTIVVGTSFNIFARKTEYRVHCLSGKVKVEVKNNEPVILQKNEFSQVMENKKLVKAQDEITSQNSISWIKNEFNFTSVQLKLVLEEIERQYDVRIEGKENFNDFITVKFSRGSSLDSILNNVIGRPFGIEFSEISKTRYRIKVK